ncbi:MAG: cation transporter [Phenylobacterium sp.]|nr:cation transporter [Phenylobacterium sp.]
MLRYQVERMSCGHCVQAITKAVKAVDPAAEVAVDLGAGRVMVDTSQEADSIVRAIEQAGYTVASAA